MKLSVNGTELYFDVVGSELDAMQGFRQRPTMMIINVKKLNISNSN